MIVIYDYLVSGSPFGGSVRGWKTADMSFTTDRNRGCESVFSGLQISPHIPLSVLMCLLNESQGDDLPMVSETKRSALHLYYLASNNNFLLGILLTTLKRM